MPGIMNSTPSTSQGFGSPALVTSDHHHDQQANQTSLRRRVSEHKINRIDENRFTLSISEYDHSKTVKTSEHIFYFDGLQRVISTLPTDVQVTDDSNTASEYQQPYSDVWPSDDLPCLSENCSLAESAHGGLNLCFSKDIQSRSNDSSLHDELKLSCDNSSVRGDQLSSTNIGLSTKIFQVSWYVSSAFEDFEETQEFCPPTVSKEFHLSGKRDEALQVYTDLDSHIEDKNEFAFFCPLTDKEQKSTDVHYRRPTPEGLQESNSLDFFCEDEKKYTRNSPWIIQRYRNLLFCKWGTQRSRHIYDEVEQRSTALHKSNEVENVTPSIPDASKSIHRPMPPTVVGRTDRIPVESSGENVFVHNTLRLIRPMSWAITKTRFLVSILLLLISQTTGEVSDVPLDCTSKVHLTSPNYPSDYPHNASMKWHVTAPLGRWILVEFNDFNVEESFDFLVLLDIVDNLNTLRFAGERSRIPSFLTRGNALDATFASFGIGTRRGFNITVSCYKKSYTSGGRLVGGNTPSEGSLELISQSGEWVGVCEDNLSATVSEVICGELGYPGVKKISYKVDGCQTDVNSQTCVRAPSCEAGTHILRDCSFASGNCTTFSSVQIECYEPGYKGCYEFSVNQLQNGFTNSSASKCASSCRGEKPQAIAILKGAECFCSTTSQVNLPGRQLVQNQGTCIEPSKNNQQIVNALVYSVSVGYCNQLDDVISGTWDSNITWFGSIVHLTCDEGYSLTGSGVLQCVPGVSPYYPVWNDSMPTCDSDLDNLRESDSQRGISAKELKLIIPMGGTATLTVGITFIMASITIIITISKKIKRNRYQACKYRSRKLPPSMPREERGQPIEFSMYSLGENFN